MCLSVLCVYPCNKYVPIGGAALQMNAAPPVGAAPPLGGAGGAHPMHAAPPTGVAPPMAEVAPPEGM